MNKILILTIVSLLIISISIIYEILRRKNLDSKRQDEFENLPYRTLDRLLSFVIENEQPIIKEGIKRPRRRFAVGFGIWLDVLVEKGRLKHCISQNGTAPIPPELSIYFDDHSHSRPADVLAAELEDEEETSHHEMDIEAGVDVDEELAKQNAYLSNSSIWSQLVSCLRVANIRYEPAGSPYRLASQLLSEGHRVLLAARPGQFLRNLLPNKLKLTGSGGMFKSDVHLRVLESSKDPSSNSPSSGGTHVVLHSDHLNAALPSVNDLEKALPDYGPRALIVSGLRSTVGVHNTDQKEIKGAFERLGSYMARLPHENLRVHLHWESLPTTPHCALAVRNVLPYVDSLSVAEPHIDALHSCILANDRFEARSIWTGNITELLDVARVIMKTLETAESESNGRRKLTRLHVLSDLFQLTIHKQRLDSRDGERWNDARAATARACLLAANLTCRARDIDLLAPLKALSQQQPDAAAKHQQQQQQQKKSEEVEEEVLAEEDSERPMSVGAAAGSGDGADADAKRRREADAAAEPQRPRLTTGWREQHYSTVLPYSNFGRARRPVPNDELHCWVERYYDFCICPVVRCAQPDVDDATDAGSSDARGAHHQHNAGVKHLATHDHIELDWAAIAAHALAAQL